MSKRSSITAFQVRMTSTEQAAITAPLDPNEGHIAILASLMGSAQFSEPVDASLAFNEH